MMYKLSKFVRHAVFTDSSNIAKRTVFSTLSGAVAIISELDWLRIISNQSELLNQETLNQLNLANILVDSNLDEVKDLLNSNKAAVNTDQTLYKVIMPSANCQLACTETSCGGYCGQTHSQHKLDDATINKIWLRCQNELISGKYKHFDVAWFGGEPLLAYDVIRNISNRFQVLARDSNCSYSASMVSNGLILSLSKARELHHKMMIKKIEITIDGAREYHDSRRCTKGSHNPTFNKIFKNICSIAKDDSLNSLQINIRANIDERNRAGVMPLLCILKEHDLHKRCNFYIAPVRPWGNDVSNIALDIQKFAEFELDTLCAMQQMGFTVNFLPRRKHITCMAVKKSAEVFDAYGLIHNCTETPYVSNYSGTVEEAYVQIGQGYKAKNTSNHNQKIDNIYATGTLDPNLKFGSLSQDLLEFYEDVEKEKFSCHDCAMLPSCGGSCPLAWQQGRIPCPPTKFNIEGRILAAYAANVILSDNLFDGH